MAIFNSRQAGMVFLSSRIVSFYNETIPQDADSYYFYESSDVNAKPKFTLSLSSFAGKNRCLQHKNFNAYAYQQTVCPFALFVRNNTCNVLFETNFFQCHQQEGSIIGTFWSTLSSGKTCKTSGNSNQVYYQYGKMFEQQSSSYYYKYDSSLVYHVNIKNLDSLTLQQSFNNIFCAVRIDLQPLYVAKDPTQDRVLQDVAVIRNLPIVLQQTKANAPVFDFSLEGSGGGGIKQHNHIPHIDGTGFAFAVFHPGTTMPQLPWSSV